MDRPELVVHGGLLSEQRLKLQCVCVGGDGGMSERERENVCIWGVSECETWYMPCVIDRDRRKGWGEGEERGRERGITLSLAHWMVCSIVAGKDLRVQ